MNKPIIYTALWGAKHLDWFKRGCLASLCWPRNKKALEGCIWNFLTHREHEEEIRALVTAAGFTPYFLFIENTSYVEGVGWVETKHVNNSVVLINGLRVQMLQCINNRKKMLLAPPDTIFGEGTIPNLLRSGELEYTCVAVPHPRVLPDLLGQISPDRPLSNESLVTESFKHLHDSWLKAEKGLEDNSSFMSGVVWEELSPSVYLVSHRLPTVYLADFLIEDHEIAWGTVGFGYYDHIWPGYIEKNNRIRYPGGSDACYIVEITEKDANVPPKTPPEVKDKVPYDHFFRDLTHNRFFRQCQYVFRGV